MGAVTVVRTRESLSDSKYLALKAIVNAVSNTSQNLIIASLGRALKNDSIRSYINKGIMAYLYAAGFLSFAGKEISRDSLSRALKAIGISPNDDLIQAILSADIKSHLVYVYAFYYLLANGMKVTEDEISDAVRAVGMEPEHSRIIDILEFLETPQA